MYYLHGGVGQLEALRKPLFVSKATYDRAKATLAPQSMGDLINPARRPVWFRTKAGLDVPYWNAPGFKDHDPMAPKSGLIYEPYWMTNKSRARLIQRPKLELKPKSQVLWHPATDEEDGLGKGFNPIKAIKRVVKITPTSFQPKKLLGALGSITATVATGGLGPIIAPGIVSANSKAMKILGGVTTAIGIGAGAVILGPVIAPTLGPILSSAAGLVGKTVTGLTGFMGVFNKLKPQQQQQAAQSLTAQQIADIEQGRATLDPNTGQLVYFGQQPGGFMPMGPAPIAPYQPASFPTDFGPPVSQGGGVAEAGMFGGLSPMMLGLMIGVPLVIQLLLKERK